MIPLCPLQQPGHHSPLTDVFSLLPPLLSPSSLLPSLPPSPPSSLPLLPVTPPPLSATLQLFVDADNAHFRTEMVEYKRKQTITRAKQVPLTVAEQCTLSVLQCTLSVLQYTVMYYNICIHTSYNTSPPLPHPPPPPFPSLSLRFLWRAVPVCLRQLLQKRRWWRVQQYPLPHSQTQD